jgi:CRP-like cAMP-binding protein
MNRKVSFDTRQADLHNPVQCCRLKKLNPDMGAAGAQQNHLLSALPAEILVRLSLNMELVSMPLGEVVCESSSQLHYVYFPTTAILSLHYLMENGESTEVVGVGNEGMFDIALFMGGITRPGRVTVQIAGYCYRLKARLLMEEFDRTGGRRGGELHDLLLRYTQLLITQISQISVCNRHHSVEQQLCRWLLLTLDRLPTNELTITQELIAGMLGVRREGITEAAGNLQREGLISYRRGHITVIDRSGLESRACECYNVVKNEYHRLLGDARNHQELQ